MAPTQLGTRTAPPARSPTFTTSFAGGTLKATAFTLALAFAFTSRSAIAQGAGGVLPPVPPSPGVAIKDVPTGATVGSSASDRDLRDSVAAALANDPQLHGARINVLVSDGAVTLSGIAHDAQQAARARVVAEGIAGASRVSAEISTAG